MSADPNVGLGREWASRAENMMSNRACEIFADAVLMLGDDLGGQSLITLLVDRSGYPRDDCRDLAAIVVERCECSDRLRETYGEDQ